jgi:hypothetical protein
MQFHVKKANLFLIVVSFNNVACPPLREIKFYVVLPVGQDPGGTEQRRK